MTIYRGLAGDLWHPPCLATPTPDQDLPAAATDLERRLSEVASKMVEAQLDAMRQHMAACASGQIDSAFMAQGALPPGLAGV